MAKKSQPNEVTYYGAAEHCLGKLVASVVAENGGTNIFIVNGPEVPKEATLLGRCTAFGVDTLTFAEVI